MACISHTYMQVLTPLAIIAFVTFATVIVPLAIMAISDRIGRG